MDDGARSTVEKYLCLNVMLKSVFIVYVCIIVTDLGLL